MTQEPEPGSETPEMLPHEEHPRGTLFLLLVYLMMIVGMWGWVYYIMLGRGGTQ